MTRKREIPKWGGWTPNCQEVSPGERSLGSRHNTASTAEDVYSDDECEFLLAIEEYKAKSGNKFPQWSVVLALLKSLGYAKGVQRLRAALEAILAEGAFDGSAQYFRIRHIAEEALGRKSIPQAHRSLPPRSELPRQRDI